MAHMIETVNGKAQMAYSGDVPWHGLGVKVPSDLTPAQMLEAAGLNPNDGLGAVLAGLTEVAGGDAIAAEFNAALAAGPRLSYTNSDKGITNLHVPGGHGVRVDSHVYAGYTIPSNYDSMISKLITVAQTREEAIQTMERALSEYVIEGVKTTIPFHQQLMQNEDFRKGNYTTKFMESFKLR